MYDFMVFNKSLSINDVNKIYNFSLIDISNRIIYIPMTNPDDIHNNYSKMTDEEKEIVDAIYNVVHKFCNEHDILIAYDDTAEVFVEAIATYLKDSE
jgi:hypothetical protein